MFEFEPGCPGDADIAARMIAETDADLFRYLTGGSLDAWAEIAAHEWRHERGIYSYTMADVVRRGAEILGLIVSYSSRRHDEIDWSRGSSAPFVREELMRHVCEASRVGGFLFPSIPPDAWYLQNIVVVPECRGTGLGRFLMDAVRDRARAAGSRWLHLDVDSSTPAVRFYERLGFETLVESRVPSIPGVHTHYRMVLSL